MGERNIYVPTQLVDLFNIDIIESTIVAIFVRTGTGKNALFVVV